MNKQFHLHLVSDATGETVLSLARAALAQFEHVQPRQHLWTMVRNQTQVDETISLIARAPGLVMSTFVNRELGNYFQDRCAALNVPVVPVMAPVLDALSLFLGDRARAKPGLQHQMDESYFDRIDAIHYCMAHDDGQNPETLHQADAILLGVSRTSKTPTCIYLANRGIKAANVPVVPGLPMPAELERLKKPFIIGLVTNPDRLVQVRRNRLLSLKQSTDSDYVDVSAVREEVVFARKYFSRHKWPILDVTRRSIEETAAAIIRMMDEKKPARAD